MKVSRRVLIWMIRGTVVALLIVACSFPGCEKTTRTSIFEKVLQSGEITVVTRNNAHCYYLYRNQAMGFEYDLAKAFADYLGVGLNVETIESFDEMAAALKTGRGQFIAASLTVLPKRERYVTFADRYMTIQQHIIVHRTNRDVRNVEDLAGRTVHVRKGSSYHERLKTLQKEGLDVRIEVHPDVPTEELIRRVAEQEIEITVADSNIALLNRKYYPQVVVAGPISEKQFLSWAVDKKADNLLKRIDAFFRTIKDNGVFAEIYNRYYADIDDFDYLDVEAFHRRIENKLPQFKPFIVQAAQKAGFDWRLIAAQIYQESHFNPRARSRSNAYGLMQIIPKTARSKGLYDLVDPQKNIEIGVEYLKDLYDFFDQAKDPDRLFIALAAYNVGQGHILDARNLAREMDLDPDKWSNISKMLPLLSYRKYYENSIYGYCRGNEPVNYVKQIMTYFDILKRQSIENEMTAKASKADSDHPASD